MSLPLVLWEESPLPPVDVCVHVCGGIWWISVGSMHWCVCVCTKGTTVVYLDKTQLNYGHSYKLLPYHYAIDMQQKVALYNSYCHILLSVLSG